MTRLYLFGLKHSGKSTLGREIAARLGWAFHDLDALVSAEDPQGRDPRRIFREDGKNVFQEYERRAALRAATLPPPLVLALGGGTVENQEAMQALDQAEGRLWVWLEEEDRVLFERVMQGGLPAFLDPDHPWESFQRLAQRRRSLARAFQPRIVSVNRRSVSECAQEILGWGEVGLAG